MDVAQHLDALRRDAPALIEAGRSADPGVRLESCPEWTAADLVWHVAGVHDFFASNVRDRWDHPRQYTAPTRPADGEALWRFAEDRAAAVLGELSTKDPATPVWSFRKPDHRADVAWAARRMAQETAMHRFDAERAAGHDHRIDADLAADGIDEFLFDIVPRTSGRGLPVLGGSVHLHCTDVAGEWIVEPADGDGYEVRREHVKGDAAMRGTASDLLLTLWRRLPLDAVDVIGDRDVAARLVGHSV